MTALLNFSYNDSGSFHSPCRSVVKGFSDNRLINQSKENRESILSLQDSMQEMESALDKFPVTHHFAPHVYARQMSLPAGYVVVGKIHKHAHLNIIVSGKVQVSTEDGLKELNGGDIFTSYAGTKRAVNVIEDTTWITIHVTEETSLDKIESEVIAESFDDIPKLTGEL